MIAVLLLSVGSLGVAAGYFLRDCLPADKPVDLFKQALTVFDRMEAEAKARGCTQDIHRYRRARKAFAEAVLRGR